MRRSRLLSSLVSLLVIAFLASGSWAGPHPSFDWSVPQDTVPFYNIAEYDTSVPAPEDHLRLPIGKWPAWHSEVAGYLHTLAESSDRMMLEPHGMTHEGRELFHLVVSTPENLAKLDDYLATMDRVADPAQVASTAELDRLTADLPAFCWMAYSIHGDEVSGTDAATRLAYHLAAAGDSATQYLLENLIILIDPCENPDGRERYLSMLQTYQSETPNYDARSLQHSGVWPWGRSNHYWFDLNRDWILLTQPETRGRVQSIVKYHPVLVVDGHEMGSNATFLFSPPRQPINYNTPENVLKWYDIFAEDQAAAFDSRGWPYYTGEWNEQWYVGYASAWPTFFGTVGILYEQAGVDGEFVKQRDNYVLTYHEAVNHQFTSSLANLATAANNRTELLRDYHNARKTIVEKGQRSGLTFLIAPDEDLVKMKRFIESLVMQGIEVTKAQQAFTVGKATDPYHEEHGSKQFPEGTYIISTAQPHGALAKAILEFDLHLNLEFLKEERRELEKEGGTRMYETSAWSVPLMYDLDAYYTTSSFSVPTELVALIEEPSGVLHNKAAEYAFVADMVGENTYVLLNELFEHKLTVYASERAFTIENRSFRPGALVLRRRGNPRDMPEILEHLVSEIGIDIYGVNTGFSMEGSHLGAPTFRLLQQPRIALLAGSPLSSSTAGHIWFAIDHELQIPHSLLSMDRIAWTDLSAYNVLIIPDSWGGGLDRALGKAGQRNLSEFVSDGGTLVLMGSSAEWAADTSNGLSGVRLKRHVLKELDDYGEWLRREVDAEEPEVDTMALWHPDKVAADENDDEQAGSPGGGKGIDEDDDRWMRRFHPRGVIMQADLDSEHWLNYGLGERLPVIVWTSRAFMAKEPVSAVARLTPQKNDLRLSGLLWPEARERWAGTAYATRERKGKGQLIMFLTTPNFRAYAYGSRQMFLNAILYGPGFTRGFEPYEK